MCADVNTYLVNFCSTNNKDFLHTVCEWCSRQEVKGSLQAGAEVGPFRCCAASKQKKPNVFIDVHLSMHWAQSGPFC